MTAALLLALTLAGPTPAPGAPLRLRRVELTIPERDVARVTLHAAPAPTTLKTGLVGQRLTLGTVAVALDAQPDVTLEAGETRVDFDVKLAAVPEQVLMLDPARIPVLWEGLDAGGVEALAVGGTIDLGDQGEADVPVATLYDLYARFSDVRVAPRFPTVGVHALLSLYNPFGFDVVSTGLEFRLSVGSQQVLAGKRPGFRLRGRQWSDVLIEQDVPLADVAGGMASFLHGEAAHLEGTLVVRTSAGERVIPLQLSAAMK